MSKLLPQANTLATVIKTFVFVSNKRDATLQDIASFCAFDVRQASYYINACIYLGLLNENYSISALGEEALSDIGKVRQKVYEIILNDDLIGRMFHHRLFHNREETKKYAKNITAEIYSDYSDAVIERRAYSLEGWCEEILDYLNQSNSL